MNTDIIKSLHEQWKAVKASAEMANRRNGNHDMADRLHDCAMFTGKETSVKEIARLFSSPGGIEFCMATGWPNLATLRMFKQDNVEKYGIYIDAGTITLHNPKVAILIGRTTATIKCDETERHEVVALHGASVTILASKWTVVHASCGFGATMARRTTDNAVIL